MNDNKTITDIKNRRSTRAYKKTPVPQDVLKEILISALYAPSGSNHRLSRFTAVKNPEILQQLNQLVKKAFCELPQEGLNAFQLAAKKHSANAAYNFYYEAPVLIIASNEQEYPNAMADCAVALENIFLAAESFGLGTCWINQLRWLTDHKEVRAFLAELGIPENHMICGAAALGYSDEKTKNRSERLYDTISIIE